MRVSGVYLRWEHVQKLQHLKGLVICGDGGGSDNAVQREMRNFEQRHEPDLDVAVRANYLCKLHAKNIQEIGQDNMVFSTCLLFKLVHSWPDTSVSL